MYALGKDTELAYHYDNAEITFNFCLGNEFSGAEVYFTHMTSVSNSSPPLHTLLNLKIATKNDVILMTLMNAIAVSIGK